MSDSSNRSYFQSLRIIHASILGGSILFLAVVRFLLIEPDDLATAAIDDPLILYLPAAVMLIGVLLGEFLFRRQVKDARPLPELIDKLNAYRAACIVRWAAIEGPVLLATIFFMLYADKYFMAIALVGMALMAFARPTPEKAVQNLQLNEEEKERVMERGL